MQEFRTNVRCSTRNAEYTKVYVKYKYTHLLFDDLYAYFSIRDQACLTALVHSSGTSSGWLKAIP